MAMLGWISSTAPFLFLQNQQRGGNKLKQDLCLAPQQEQFCNLEAFQSAVVIGANIAPNPANPPTIWLTFTGSSLNPLRGTRFGPAQQHHPSGPSQSSVGAGDPLRTPAPGGGAKVIFLDEPISGLDSTSAFKVVKAIRDLTVEDSRTVLMTIHRPGTLFTKAWGAIINCYITRGNQEMERLLSRAALCVLFLF